MRKTEVKEQMGELFEKLQKAEAEVERWRGLPVAMREHGLPVGDYPVNVAAVVVLLKERAEKAEAKLTRALDMLEEMTQRSWGAMDRARALLKELKP